MRLFFLNTHVLFPQHAILPPSAILSHVDFRYLALISATLCRAVLRSLLFCQHAPSKASPHSFRFY